MAQQGNYPLNGRVPVASDTATGVVTGYTADIPLGDIAALVPLATISAPGIVEPDGTTITITDGVISASSGSGIVQSVVAGTGIAVDDTDPANPVVSATTTGTVSSVALTAPAQFTVAGSPITTNGTLAVTWNTQTAAEVLAGPATGSAAAPTFRALTLTDMPSGLATSGANSNITSLTGLTTALTVGQGGMGSGTHTAHGVLIGEGTSAVVATSAGTTGQMLVSGGASADPSFSNAPVITGGTIDNAPIGATTPSTVVASTLNVTSAATSGVAATISQTSNTTNGASLTLLGDGATAPSKTLRVHAGSFNIMADNNIATLLTLSNGGSLTISGGISGTSITASNGFIMVTTIGDGVKVAEGTNAKQGVATLVGGTVVVANTSVTASSRIFLTHNSPSGTLGVPYVAARTAGTSFTITSTSALDTSVVAYEIFEPA